MKKLSVLVVLAVAVMFAASAPAQIASSAHDFSSTAWGGGEICKACHTPHNAYPYAGQGPLTTQGPAPLWNHASTATVFQTYVSPTSTFNGSTTITAPAGVSLACLSCHDGTVGMESFGGVSGVAHLMTGTAVLGADLRNDHPVSFTYNTALATTDGELEDPATNATVAGLLFSSKMECGSCHDVHNGTGFTSMLVIDNAGSALCLTCHTK